MDIEKVHLSAEATLTNDQGAVKIYLDDAAIDRLIVDLKALKEKGDHIHYFSDDWGGHSLKIANFESSEINMHHIKITKI